MDCSFRGSSQNNIYIYLYFEYLHYYFKLQDINKENSFDKLPISPPIGRCKKL